MNLMREIMFENDAESMESSEKAILEEPIYAHENLQYLICYGTSISDMDKETLESVLY